jgi:carbon monoxide dehydrogenase subunit G
VIVVENAVTLAHPAARVVDALLQVEHVVDCLPGARLIGAVDDRHALGQVSLNLGDATMTFRGSLHILGEDPTVGSVTFRAKGRELRGEGDVEATIEVRLKEADGTTLLSLHSEGGATGRLRFLREAVVITGVREVLSAFGSSFDAFLSEEASALTAISETRSSPSDERRGETGGITDRIAAATQKRVGQPEATDVPAVQSRLPQPLTMAQRVAKQVERRPWLIPAAAVTAIVVALGVRRRR